MVWPGTVDHSQMQNQHPCHPTGSNTYIGIKKFCKGAQDSRTRTHHQQKPQRTDLADAHAHTPHNEFDGTRIWPKPRGHVYDTEKGSQRIKKPARYIYVHCQVDIPPTLRFQNSEFSQYPSCELSVTQQTRTRGNPRARLK